jgi:hypothetical protein
MLVNIIQTISNLILIPDDIERTPAAVADYLDEYDRWPNINNGEWKLLDVVFPKDDITSALDDMPEEGDEA